MKRLISLALLLTLALQPQLAHAAPDGGVSAYPSSSFHFRLGQGQTTTDSITVVNEASTPQEITLYPVDATATSEGSLAMRNQTEPRTGLGRWISLAKSHLRLGPHQSQRVSFTITTPIGAEAGDHVGGIIVQPDASRSITSDQNVHLQVISRFALRLYETIPGNRLNLVKITQFKLEPRQKLSVALTIANGGNVAEWPRGQISIAAAGSSKVETFNLPPMMLLPHRSARLNLTSRASRPLLWQYHAHLDLRYNDRLLQREQTSLWYDRTALLLVVLIAVALLGYSMRKKIAKIMRHLTNI